jgi:CheY-like chemotaxis protein
METKIPEIQKVCIVDDDSYIREIYQRKFEEEGFSVVTAVDGEEGLAVIREHKPHIILLDLQMPVRDGVSVLKVLREDPELSKIPVIVLSNQEDDETLKTVGKFETRFYLIKSWTTPQKAVDTVREVLP